VLAAVGEPEPVLPHFDPFKVLSTSSPMSNVIGSSGATGRPYRIASLTCRIAGSLTRVVATAKIAAASFFVVNTRRSHGQTLRSQRVRI
jgi:hypothetical protein